MRSAEPSPESRQMGGIYVCAGGLYVRAGGGVDIQNLTKLPLTSVVSYFNLGVCGALFRGLSPPNPPVATALA